MTEKKAKTPHGEFHVFEGDHIGDIMLSGAHYESVYIAAILNACTDRSGTAIDVGANIGTHTVPYANRFRHVVAFEPQPAVFNLLQKNVARFNNVEAWGCALAHAANTMYMTPADAPQNTGSIPLKLSGDVQVDVRTLDSFGFKNVELIKIDVEGAESLVLYGAQKTIKAWKPVLFFEYDKTTWLHNKLNLNTTEIDNFDVLRFLLDVGYTRFMRLGGKNVLVTL